MSRPRVLVVGPGRASAGGVQAAIAALCGSQLGERFILVKVATHRDGPKWLKALWAAGGLLRVAVLLAARRVDAVDIHAASYASFRRKMAVALMARAAGRPYVLHVHGGHFDRYYLGSSGAERALVRRTLVRAARVIALTPEWERRIRAICACRTAVIPNPVLIPTGGADPAARPAHVVSLGRLGDEKGSRVLVRALALLGDRHGAARLTLAGDGDAAPVRVEAERHGLADRVATPGWLTGPARDALLRSATLFALPSRAEGLPLALLEAMAFGLPVVATPVGGVPEAIDDGVQGLLVPPDDPAALAVAIAAILDDPKEAARMGSAARGRAKERYAVSEVAGAVGDALAAAVGVPAKPAPPFDK